MSHINKEKGIEDLIAVSKLLPSNYTLDIYGEIKEDKYRNINFNESGITYHGVVSSEQVLKTLVEYDLLLLPSYREGYPGHYHRSYVCRHSLRINLMQVEYLKS